MHRANAGVLLELKRGERAVRGPDFRLALVHLVEGTLAEDARILARADAPLFVEAKRAADGGLYLDIEASADTPGEVTVELFQVVAAGNIELGSVQLLFAGGDELDSTVSIHEGEEQRPRSRRGPLTLGAGVGVLREPLDEPAQGVVRPLVALRAHRRLSRHWSLESEALLRLSSPNTAPGTGVAAQLALRYGIELGFDTRVLLRGGAALWRYGRDQDQRVDASALLSLGVEHDLAGALGVRLELNDYSLTRQVDDRAAVASLVWGF